MQCYVVAQELQCVQSTVSHNLPVTYLGKFYCEMVIK